MLLSKQNQFLLNRRILGLHQQFKQPNGHVWRKSRFPSDRSKYVKQAHLCNRMMERPRQEHIANYIHENENDAGKLWRAVNSVLHRVPNTSMPSKSDITTVCHSFSTFFVNKIEKIRMCLIFHHQKLIFQFSESITHHTLIKETITV